MTVPSPLTIVIAIVRIHGIGLHTDGGPLVHMTGVLVLPRGDTTTTMTIA